MPSFSYNSTLCNILLKKVIMSNVKVYLQTFFGPRNDKCTNLVHPVPRLSVLLVLWLIEAVMSDVSFSTMPSQPSPSWSIHTSLLARCQPLSSSVAFKKAFQNVACPEPTTHLHHSRHRSLSDCKFTQNQFFCASHLPIPVPYTASLASFTYWR